LQRRRPVDPAYKSLPFEQAVGSARIALAVAFSTVVAAELMAATDGLGWMVFSASHFLRNDIIVLGIIVLGILGMLLNQGILLIDRAVVHWRGVE
jgi:taurine transport system permease protein